MHFQLNPFETTGALLKQPIDYSSLDVVVPICPYSFMANKAFLGDYLPWVSEHCNRGIVVVGDYLERHNIQVFEDLDGIAATNKAVKKGETIRRRIREILSQKNVTNIELIDIKDVMEEADFQANYESVKVFSTKHSPLDDDINEQVFMMLSTSERAQFITTPITLFQMDRLKEYLFEEISFYLTMYQRGFKTEIYPGRDMPIMHRIARSEYIDFPVEFSDRTHISVKQGVKRD